MASKFERMIVLSASAIAGVMANAMFYMIGLLVVETSLALVGNIGIKQVEQTMGQNHLFLVLLLAINSLSSFGSGAVISIVSAHRCASVAFVCGLIMAFAGLSMNASGSQPAPSFFSATAFLFNIVFTVAGCFARERFSPGNCRRAK